MSDCDWGRLKCLGLTQVGSSKRGLKRSMASSWRKMRHAFALRRQKWKMRLAERRRKRSKSKKAGSSRFQKTLKNLEVWYKRTQIRLLAWWRKKKSTSKIVRMVSKRQRLFFWLFIFSLTGVFVVFALSEVKDRDAENYLIEYANRTAIKVNGVEISTEKYLKTLELAYGPEILQKLTEQEVVRQEAQRLGLELSQEDIEKLEFATRDAPNRTLVEAEILTSFLLRKIVLHSVAKDRKLEVYNTFKEDLVVYSLLGYRFESRQKAKDFESGIAAGLSLGAAGKKFSRDGAAPQRVGTFTLPQIRAQLGDATAEAVENLPLGKRSPPLNTVGGVAVYILESKGTSFEEVEPAIDTLIVEAETNQVLFELLSKADVESPYLREQRLKSEATGSPTPAPTSSPSP